MKVRKTYDILELSKEWSDLNLDLIKGYVQYYDQKIPVTWEDETEKYAKNVRKVHILHDKIIVDSRIFDDKVSKKEIFTVKPMKPVKSSCS